MAVTGRIDILGSFQGAIGGPQTITIPILLEGDTVEPQYSTNLSLPAGANTLLLPPGGSGGVLIVPPSNNTQTLRIGTSFYIGKQVPTLFWVDPATTFLTLNIGAGSNVVFPALLLF